MKLQTEAFPFPVLSPDIAEANDYQKTEFHCTIEAEKATGPQGENMVNFKCSFVLSNSEITDLIKRKEACYMLEVTCRETGFKQIYSSNDKELVIPIPIGSLYDRVELYPLIVVTSPIQNYTSRDLHEEYWLDPDDPEKGFQTFELNPGDMIAFDEPTIKYFSFESLGIRSLLKVVLDEEQDEDCYEIDPSGDDELKVRMGKEIKSLWDNPETKDYLFMPVIKDAILVALDEYRADKESIQEKKWAKLFIDTIGAQRIIGNESVNELNLKAQEVSRNFCLMKIKNKANN